jgi:FdhE protein
MTLTFQPHLKEVRDLFRKVQEFETSVKLKYTYRPEEDSYHQYIKEDVDTVMRAFSKSFGLDPKEMNKFKEALESGSIDFLMLRDDKVATSDEEFPVMYILSRPFFRSMKHLADSDDTYWQEGRCPVCNAVPSLSIIEREARRRYSCSYCGCIGLYKRIGCPFCKNYNPEKLNIMLPEDNDEIRIDTCSDCKSYIKTFQSSLTAEHFIDELDLMSLPLDIAAQNKGFLRRSPNPVGMVRIR